MRRDSHTGEREETPEKTTMRRPRSHSIGRADGPQGPDLRTRAAALRVASARAHEEVARLERATRAST